MPSWVHSQCSMCSIAAAISSSTWSSFAHRVDRVGGDLELVVGDEQELGLLGDLHERRRTFLGELHRRFERADVEPVAVARLGERQRLPRELLHREAADVLGVHPLELLRVERGGRVVHAPEIELGDQLVAIEDLAAVFGRPAEQREVVDDRVGEEALLLVLLDRDRAVPLRELGAAGADDQRQVRVHGLLVDAERAPQRQHAVRRVDQVLAAQHVRDAHVDVVDRVREEEHRRAVGPDDDEVGDRRPVDGDLAADRVHERAASRIRRAEPDRTRATFGPARRRARPA